MTNTSYLRQRISYLFATYHLRWLRLLGWPLMGGRRLVLAASPNQRNPLIQVAGWWLGLLFLLLDLVFIGDLYEIVAVLVKQPRPLTKAEKAIAEEVFGGVLRWRLVRLDEAARWVCKRKKLAYVSMFTINSWGKLSNRTLIHELVHVWQYQKLGLAYIPMALLAQVSKEAYNYGGVQGLQRARQAGLPLSSYNLEQQAEIIADYFLENQQPGLHRQPALKDHVSVLEHFASQLREV